jgi:pimeloyl-ACP methyl ester carboxylesterase
MRIEPVVLIHCSGSSGAQWRALAASLSDRYHVLAPDLIGYGGSAPWTSRAGFCLAQEAAPIRSLIGRLERPVHLVGHSYGGAVALHIARTRPELLSSLTLIEPSAFHLLRGGDAIDTAGLEEIMQVAADVSASAATGDLVGGFGRFVDYWSGPGSWAAMPAEKRAAFAPQLAKVALDFHALFSESAGLEDVRGIALPTLVLQGGCTRLPSRCIVRRLRDALPEAAFRFVQGAGHMLPITHRDEVNRHIAAHIDANAVQTRRATWKACRPVEQATATLSA